MDSAHLRTLKFVWLLAWILRKFLELFLTLNIFSLSSVVFALFCNWFPANPLVEAMPTVTVWKILFHSVFSLNMLSFKKWVTQSIFEIFHTLNEPAACHRSKLTVKKSTHLAKSISSIADQTSYDCFELSPELFLDYLIALFQLWIFFLGKLENVPVSYYVVSTLHRCCSHILLELSMCKYCGPHKQYF